MGTNGKAALEVDRVVERVAALEDAVDEIAADLSEHDVRLQRISDEVAQVVAVVHELRAVVRRLSDERTPR